MQCNLSCTVEKHHWVFSRALPRIFIVLALIFIVVITIRSRSGSLPFATLLSSRTTRLYYVAATYYIRNNGRAVQTLVVTVVCHYLVRCIVFLFVSTVSAVIRFQYNSRRSSSAFRCLLGHKFRWHPKQP